MGETETKRPIIRIKNLTKSYNKGNLDQSDYILSDINLEIQEGEFHVLLGPSGCGKSTLLNIIAGFIKPTSGELTIDGEEIQKPSRERGVVFQNADSAIFPWLTVRQNVNYGLRINKVKRTQRKGIIDKYIKLVGLQEHENKFPHELSGGMKQRLQIARALANDSKILIMDEPFGALDAHTRRIMQSELTKLWQQTGKTILFVTHDIQEAILLSQRISIMSKAPNAQIYKQHIVELPYPRRETGKYFSELYTTLQGYFDFGAGI